jgi:tetratricopeptide (TPR) repeat protein
VKNAFRTLAAFALVFGVCFGASQSASGSPKKPAPSASADADSASPAPLPTATPEPPEIAVPRLEAKIKENPNDKDSLRDLTSYYLAENRPDAALALTQRLLSLGDKTAQVYYLDGVANQGLGKIKEATEDFELATTQDPTNAQILLTLTNLYLQTNRGADAERIAKRATTFNPNDKRVYENYGLVLGQEGKFDEARTQFEAAEKLDPKDAMPVVLEARAYVSQKALALAAQDFDRALTIDPKSTDALLGKASLQAAEHNVADAIATYEQLYGVETSDEAKAAVILQEYSLYRDEKMNDDALAQLKRADSAYPNVLPVHLAYGDYDFQVAKDPNAGEAEWKLALGPTHDNPQALDRLGELALSQGKFSDALGYFKHLAEVVPNDPGVLLKLGQVLSLNKQYDEARRAYLGSFQQAHSPAALAGLGTADFELRNYKECTQVFGAIDHNAGDFMKQNPQLLYVYAKCAVGISDKTTARSAYTRFRTYVKPGTQLAAEVDKAIRGLGGSSSPHPAATAKPRT